MAMVVVQNPAPVMQPPVMMVQQPASPTVVMMQQPAMTHVVMQQQQSQQPEGTECYPSAKLSQANANEFRPCTLLTGGASEDEACREELISVVCKAKLGGKPTITACNSCKQRMQTRVLYKVGWFSWAMAILLCFIGLFWGPCLIAFFWSKCKDAHHYCTACNAKLDVHKPCC